MDVCIGNPVQAKEIDALYVLWKSRVVTEPRKVWVITLRGISMPSLGPPPGFSQARAYEYTRMRTVVDANTGKAIMASGYPHVEPISVKIIPPGLKGETDEQKQLIANMNKLYKGMSKEEVKKLLGNRLLKPLMCFFMF